MSSEGKRRWTIYVCAECGNTTRSCDHVGLIDPCRHEVALASEIERLGAELNEERALGFKKEDRNMLLAEAQRLREAIEEHQRTAPRRLDASNLPIGGEVYAVQPTKRDDRLYAALKEGA